MTMPKRDKLLVEAFFSDDTKKHSTRTKQGKRVLDQVTIETFKLASVNFRAELRNFRTAVDGIRDSKGEFFSTEKATLEPFKANLTRFSVAIGTMRAARKEFARAGGSLTEDYLFKTELDAVTKEIEELDEIEVAKQKARRAGEQQQQQLKIEEERFEAAKGRLKKAREALDCERGKFTQFGGSCRMTDIFKDELQGVAKEIEEVVTK